MKRFEMCERCRVEYENPLNRRFHAQPNACSKCGPRLELWTDEGGIMETHHKALLQTVESLLEGSIVAIKGLGGFHLFADASNEESVRRLRKRKHREQKPFALMFPYLKLVEQYCEVSQKQRELLLSREAPIVLLKRKNASGESELVAPSVAPNNPYWGVMLPATPLHHVFMRELNRPAVATSGNISDEPLCIDEQEALRQLKGIADLFLVHNRPIVRHVDDSVVKIVMGRPMIIRRARGYAPLPVSIKEGGKSVLALGAHLKNTIALSVNNNVFVSQHIGDLETEQSWKSFNETINSFKKLYEPDIDCLVRDQHPDYLSTKYAVESNAAVVSVQHHHAHIVSCMAENQLEGTVLGIAWDGTGAGTDQTIWGGEFLVSTMTDFKREAYFRRFPLPGGEIAIKEPRRAALGLLSEIFKEDIAKYEDLPCFKSFSSEERHNIQKMLSGKLNSPMTSSVGRLFDAVASLIDVCHVNSYEGQAAMSLEYLLKENLSSSEATCEIYSCPLFDGNNEIDWKEMIEQIIQDVRSGVSNSEISFKFHNTLVEIAVGVARRIGEKRIVLSGGCFQNTYLSERMITRLQQEGFSVYWHQNIPPNDGGISFGQAVSGIYQASIKQVINF